MDDRVINDIRNGFGYWSPDLDDETVFEDFKHRFQQMSPPDRQKTLQVIDQVYFNPTDADGNLKEFRATKENAAILTKRRELDDLHKLLWRVNR
jgi:hypothetical protein